MLIFSKLILIVSCCFWRIVLSYRPVVIVHGILADDECMDILANHIRRAHLGTEVYITSRFSNWSSLEEMWHQVLHTGQDVMKLSALYPDGINMIGYSQGGLVARGILEYFSGHGVQTFISLSSPQGGQYGTQFLIKYFPNLAARTAYKLFYTGVGQQISVANYWRDPHHRQLYYNVSRYLPLIDNEKLSRSSASFKDGILAVQKMIFIAGPDDEVITPWQSGHFGILDGDEEKLIDLEDREMYKNDLIGLRTLKEAGRLHMATISGVTHHQWYRNLSVINEHILPWLD